MQTPRQVCLQNTAQQERPLSGTPTQLSKCADQGPKQDEAADGNLFAQGVQPPPPTSSSMAAATQLLLQGCCVIDVVVSVDQGMDLFLGAAQRGGEGVCVWGLPKDFCAGQGIMPSQQSYEVKAVDGVLLCRGRHVGIRYLRSDSHINSCCCCCCQKRDA